MYICTYVYIDVYLHTFFKDISEDDTLSSALAEQSKMAQQLCELGFLQRPDDALMPAIAKFYHANMPHLLNIYLSCWWSVLFHFLFEMWVPSLQIWAQTHPKRLVEVCQILGLWRKAGVEIQDFDYPGLGI